MSPVTKKGNEYADFTGWTPYPETNKKLTLASKAEADGMKGSTVEKLIDQAAELERVGK